jgi:hypothetical protein
MAENLEQKIKDYLWFHLSKKNKKVLLKYFKDNDHWATGKRRYTNHFQEYLKCFLKLI